METKDKKYILKNINSKSIKEIAQELNLKEKKVKKFLEKEMKKDGVSQISGVTTTPRNKKVLLACTLLIIIFGFMVYSNSIDGEFIWDDNFLVRDNPDITAWSHIPKLFSTNIGAGAGSKNNSYRPMQMLTYMFDYSAWGLDVKGYHLTNIILHIFVALSVFWLINLLFGNLALSLLTSLIFVVHPVHTEAVAYISGRADPLAAMFMLLSLACYIRHLRTGNRYFYVIMLFSFICALLSKESSLILIAAMLVYHFVFAKKIEFVKWIPAIFIGLLYITLRFTILKFELPNTYSSTLGERIPGVFVALTDYLRLTIFPFALHMQYGYRPFQINEPKALLGGFILLVALFCVIKFRNKNHWVVFPILWFLIMLFPVSNLYPVNAYMAEHWLYLPSIGVFLIMAKGLIWVSNRSAKPIWGWGIGACLIAYFSFLTVQQNSYWQNPTVFNERTLKYSPTNAKIYNAMGARYNDNQKYQEAEEMFKKAISLDPDYVKAYYNLGVVYNNTGRIDEAIDYYKQTIAMQPTYLKAYLHLGELLSNTGMIKEALSVYKKLIEIEPNYGQAHYKLTMLYYNEKQYEWAVEHCDKAMQLGYKIEPVIIQILNKYRK